MLTMFMSVPKKRCTLAFHSACCKSLRMHHLKHSWLQERLPCSHPNGWHSFVVADDDLVAGPVFDDDNSRHAPAVHVATGTPFGQKYSTYFGSLWDCAQVA